MTAPARRRARQVAEAPDAGRLPRLLAGGGPDIATHLDTWGQMPGGGTALIREVERAGLLGRGGARFPMAVKLRSVAGQRRPVVVGNGVEREPVSSKDRLLVATAPHLVLDGLSIAADTVGAAEAIVCLDRGDRHGLVAVRRALHERQAAGADRVPLRVEAVASPYVAGEETALIHWLNGGPAKPTFTPPRPYEKGFGGRPTLVNNVETLAHLALVARFGADWFRALGTPQDPGSALVTLTGNVGRPGVVEIPLGATVSDVISLGDPPASPQALLIGGYAGAWVSYPRVAALGFDSASLKAEGASVGCGAVSVLGAGECGLAATASVLRWMAGQSAGQCGPCVNGLPALAEAFEGLVAGDRRGRASRRVTDLGDVIVGRGACHHPDGAVRLARSALHVFRDEVELHRQRGGCGGTRRQVLPLPPGPPEWR